MEAALEGRDSLIVMPTGGGKSLCYQLPGLASEDLTIVVSPLIALMRDQWLRLTAAGHPVAMISSGMDEGDAGRRWTGPRGEARIVYCAPERFASNVFLEALAQRRVDLLAVDEAHCVSEWGHDFRPDYLRLPQIAERLGRPTVMACTATATKPVAAEIAPRFGMREPLQVRAGFDRPNLSFDVVAARGQGLQGAPPGAAGGGARRPGQPAGDRLLRHPQGHRRGRRDAARGGAAARSPTTPGWKPKNAPRSSGASWAARAEVVVATNAFGMGVDKADVRSVWHMAIPTSVEAYYQEAGRGGRDGLPARAVLLAMKTDLGRLVRFNEQRAGDPELAIAHERGWRAYRAIKELHLLHRCRRRSLLAHFGDRAAGAPLERCCDVCDLPTGCPTRRRSPCAGRRPSRSAAPAPDLSAADAPLFEALKAWRLRAAAGKPAYTVANNKTLAAIAALPPRRPRATDRDQRRRPHLRRQVRRGSPGDRRRARTATGERSRDAPARDGRQRARSAPRRRLARAPRLARSQPGRGRAGRADRLPVRRALRRGAARPVAGAAREALRPRGAALPRAPPRRHRRRARRGAGDAVLARRRRPRALGRPSTCPRRSRCASGCCRRRARRRAIAGSALDATVGA